MQIFVRNFLAGGFSTMILEVEGSDTIGSLMAQLEDRAGVPPVMQYLSCGGRPLHYHDAGTLAEHKVRRYSTLDATYSPSGHGCYELKAETLRSLGFDVVKRADDDAADKMEIFVRDCMVPCRRGRRVRTVVLEVDAGDTVACVMVQIQCRLGYPPALQALYYHRTRLLHDIGGTLADYKVHDGSVRRLDMNYDEARRMKGEQDQSAAGAAAGC